MHTYKLSAALATVIVASLNLNYAIAAQSGFNFDMSAQEQPKKPGKQAPKVQRRQIQQQKIIVQPNQHRAPVTQQNQPAVRKGQFTRQPAIQQRTVTTQRKLGQPKQFGHVTIRNAGHLNVAGGNYSVWHEGYRVQRNGYWRTFVGLGALGAVMFGSAYYYPYAYIDAPAPYCDGLTEDGCQLEWEAIPTVEGPTEYACVAYCPWR